MFSLLLAPVCAACGAPTVARREVLCSGCSEAMPWLDLPCCRRCALPLPCGSSCPARSQEFSAAWAAAAHAGPARSLVGALKFRGAIGIAETLGVEMARRAPASLLSGGVLVPVPTNAWRRRRRGLDHTLLLTEAIARERSIAVAVALRRVGTTAPRQAGQSRRIRTDRGRIHVEVTTTPPPICVLVDDVYTTGSTLDACSAVLLAAGSRSVRVMTFARTLPPTSGRRMVTTPTFRA